MSNKLGYPNYIDGKKVLLRVPKGYIDSHYTGMPYGDSPSDDDGPADGIPGSIDPSESVTGSISDSADTSGPDEEITSIDLNDADAARALKRRNRNRADNGSTGAGSAKRSDAASRAEVSYYEEPRRKYYGKILIGYILLLCLLSAGVLFYVWQRLDNYQKTKDKIAGEEEHDLMAERAPQEYFESYIDSMTSADWTGLWMEAHPDSFDTEEIITKVMEDKFAPDTLEKYRSSDYTDTVPAFLLAKSGEYLAKITLKGSDLDYSTDNVEFLFKGDQSASVSAPSDCTVSIGDKVLGTEHISSSEAGAVPSEYADQMVNPVTYDEYTLSELFEVPTFTVTGTHTLANDENNNYFYVLEGEDASAYSEDADSFIGSLLNYYKLGKSNTEGNMSSVLSHVASSSHASEVIRNSYDGMLWSTPHDGITYTLTVSDPLILADNCIAVDVTYHCEGEGTEAAGLTDGTYRVFFMDLGDGYKIYDFELR